MKSRLLASVAVGAAVALGATGCGMISPQGTTVHYSPSDGINIPDSSGPLQVRNVLIVANEDGTEGNLVAAIANDTDSSGTLHIEVGTGSDAVSKTIRVPAHSAKSLGAEDIEGVDNFQGVEPVLITGLELKPGSTVPIYFRSGDSQGVRTEVPVLDGTLTHLATLAP